MSKNLQAFLDMIAFSEGTYGKGANGYNVLVGGTLFDNGYADHPRKLVKLSATLSSTAAGRYQLLARYYDDYRKQLGLADFKPSSQDAIAVQQIKGARRWMTSRRASSTRRCARSPTSGPACRGPGTGRARTA